MWWPRRAVVFVLLALAAPGPLAGCGFSSLYGKQAAAPVVGELEQIRIHPIEDRVGQIVRNHLLDLLNPGGRPANPRYDLRVTLRETVSRLAVERNAFATRANLNLNADFLLVDRATGRQLYASQDTVIGSFNLYDSDFATLTAERDARKRAAQEISQIIRTKLAAYFSQLHGRRGRS